MSLHVRGRGLRRQRAGHVNRPVRVVGHVYDRKGGRAVLADPDGRPVDASAIHFVPYHRAVPVITLEAEEAGRNTQKGRPRQVVEGHPAHHLVDNRAPFIGHDVGLFLRARDPVHAVDHVHYVASHAHNSAGPVNFLEHQTLLLFRSHAAMIVRRAAVKRY